MRVIDLRKELGGEGDTPLEELEVSRDAGNGQRAD